MANLRLVPRNFHDEATLSTQYDPETNFDAENTQNSIRSRVWRSTDGTTQYIRGTFADGLARTPAFFGFFRHRCHGGKVRLQLYSDTAWTTQVYDSTAVDIYTAPSDGFDWGINPYGTGSNDPFATEAPYYLWFTGVACKSYQITFSSNVSTFGAAYWQVSRFVLGPRLEVGLNPECADEMMGWADQTDRNRSRGGSLRTNVGPIWKEMQFELKLIAESERAAWLQILRQLGTGRDFVLSLFPEDGDGTSRERDHTVLCKYKNLNRLGRWVNRLTGKIQIEEV